MSAPNVQLTAAILKQKQRASRSEFTKEFATRIHRSISWLLRAERESNDPDAQFIFLWIAFNAAYSVYEDVNTEIQYSRERRSFRHFLKEIAGFDEDERIYEIIWDRFAGPIRLLLENQYVFQPYWHHQNGVVGFQRWEDSFRAAQGRARKAIEQQDTGAILSIIFERLYVLRNQLLHGGATWQSAINRAQVKDGANILAFIVPLLIDIMMAQHDHDWGSIYYPVIE